MQLDLLINNVHKNTETKYNFLILEVWLRELLESAVKSGQS